MSRPTWWRLLTRKAQEAGWWAIPYGVGCAPHQDNLEGCDCRPPRPPWVHTSHARGWPRCSVCQCPVNPAGRCPHGTGKRVHGDYRCVPHWQYPTYALRHRSSTGRAPVSSLGDGCSNQPGGSREVGGCADATP